MPPGDPWFCPLSIKMFLLEYEAGAIAAKVAPNVCSAVTLSVNPGMTPLAVVCAGHGMLEPPPVALITPAFIPVPTVIVVPSGFTAPKAEVVATGRSAGWMVANAGAALFDWIRNLVVALAFTATDWIALVPLPYRIPFAVMVPSPVPPRGTASVPVHPAVMDAELSSAMAELPPNVSVTLVSFVLVSALPVGPVGGVAHVPSPRQ